MKLDNDQIVQMIDRILTSPKYRDKGIHPDTIRDLITQEAPHSNSSKILLKSVRRKLHNIIAPYLGEPDYEELAACLSGIERPSLDSSQLKTFCLEVLSQHASTAERMPHLESFYNQIFEVTGKPDSVLDLACGLHPVGFPFMNLPVTTQYYAYDIIQPRVDFINLFFTTLSLLPLAENRDILVSPPPFHADLAFFLKEAHRFEKRTPGCNRDFWASLDVNVLVVSLPSQNLAGTHQLSDQHRNLVHENLPDSRETTELQIGDEMVFIIQKQAG